jgi:SnoaL-like domain
MTAKTDLPLSGVMPVAMGLIRMCREGRFVDAVKEYYAPNIVSCQAMSCGENPRIEEGFETILGNNERWVANHDIHTMELSEPFVSEGGFSVIYTMDFTVKSTGQRITGREVAVYDVENGKIVRECFYMDPSMFECDK